MNNMNPLTYGQSMKRLQRGLLIASLLLVWGGVTPTFGSSSTFTSTQDEKPVSSQDEKAISAPDVFCSSFVQSRVRTFLFLSLLPS